MPPETECMADLLEAVINLPFERLHNYCKRCCMVIHAGLTGDARVPDRLCSPAEGACATSANGTVVLYMQVQLAVLGSLTGCVAQLKDAAMEFLLQKVLMVLTLLHRRPATSLTPPQLQALAQACFSALRAADTCEVGRTLTSNSFSLIPHGGLTCVAQRQEPLTAEVW